MARNIRPHMTFESCSRGLQIINNNIEALMAEFDLTLDEWHYWADITNKASSC